MHRRFGIGRAIPGRRRRPAVRCGVQGGGSGVRYVGAANNGRVVSNVVVQALQGEPLTIYGDGSQTRSFCVVDDLVEGSVRLGTLESAPDGPINLGNEREVTIAEIADPALAMTGSGSGVERLPLPQDDLGRRRPDTTRAART